MHIHSNISRGPQPNPTQELNTRDLRIETMEKEFFRKRAVEKIESAKSPSLLEKATKLQQETINIFGRCPCPPNCILS